ncbi:MAG: hypothetical protein ACYC6J_01525 [Coriobacteriia bacterium]
MARKAVTIGFSVTPEIEAKIARWADEGGRSKSDLFREMVRVYEREREHNVLEELAEYGQRRAAKRSLTSEEDVMRRIKELRGVAYPPGH